LVGIYKNEVVIFTLDLLIAVSQLQIPMAVKKSFRKVEPNYY